MYTVPLSAALEGRNKCCTLVRLFIMATCSVYVENLCKMSQSAFLIMSINMLQNRNITVLESPLHHRR